MQQNQQVLSRSWAQSTKGLNQQRLRQPPLFGDDFEVVLSSRDKPCTFGLSNHNNDSHHKVKQEDLADTTLSKINDKIIMSTKKPAKVMHTINASRHPWVGSVVFCGVRSSLDFLVLWFVVRV